MKNIILSVFLILTAWGISSCDNDFEPPTEFSHPMMLYTGTTVNIDGNVSFSDLSHGVVNRRWIFPEGVVDILESSNDTVANSQIVHAKFIKAGTYDVRFVSELLDATYNIDSIIPVTVLDTVAAKIFDNAPLIDGVRTVEAGSEVRFSSLSTGSPDSYDWIFEGADPESATDSTVLVKYKKLGAWDVTLIAFRDSPWGRDTIVMNDYITVIPSSQPVTIDKIYQTEDKKIGLGFSRELQYPVDQAMNFSVINNGAEVNILSVTQDQSDATILYVEVEGGIINIDDATISYTPGNLISTDFVEVDAFTNIPVQPRLVNLLPVNTDLESGTIDGFNGWGAAGGSIDITSDDAYSGNYSIKLVYGEGDYHLGTGSNPVQFKAGKTYRVEFMIKNADPTAGDIWHYWQLTKLSPWASLGAGWFASNGDWTKISGELPGDDWDDGYLDIVSRAPGAYYVDDIAIYELESRE